MFEEMADKIFAEADFPKDGNEHLWAQCVSILSNTMAAASATMGLSMKRAAHFEEQRRSLVQDLINMKGEANG